MKKLLFNGCSFTAGDELVWGKFTNDQIPWQNAHSLHKELYLEYKNVFRRQHNLSAQCANMLGTTAVDLSEDGNSNTNIAMTTINYILSIPVEERKNWHVCVGWTSFERRLKWIERDNSFGNLNLNHYYDKLFYKEYHPYILEEIINNTDIDHLMYYIRDFMLLENFLKANGITYTFWRALGGRSGHDTYLNNPKAKDTFMIKHTISDDRCWVPFCNTDTQRWYGDSWVDRLARWDDFINEINQHPNIDAVIKLANKLKPFIEQGMTE